MDPKSIKEGTFTKMRCNKGYRVSFNRDNIDCFETHPEPCIGDDDNKEG